MLERVRRVLAEDRPKLPRYAAEEDAEWPAWAALTLDEIRERLAALRAELAALVGGLTDAQLARTGIHPRSARWPCPCGSSSSSSTRRIISTSS